MAASNKPIFVAVPKSPQVRISTANTNRDGTGTLGTLCTAGSNGAFYPGFRYQAESTTTAGMIRIFKQTGGSGNNELLREMNVSAVTPSATVQAASDEWFPDEGIVLGAGDVILVGTHNGETFGCHLMGGGDY